MYAEQSTLSTSRATLQPGDQARRTPQKDRRTAPADGGEPGPRDGTLEHAPEIAALLREVDGLRRRLETQPVIEQAKGVLVGFYAIDPDTAFTVLVRWSQQTNTKLRLLAGNLVAAATSNGGESQAELRKLLDQLTGSGTLSLAAEEHS